MQHPFLYEINTRCWLAELSREAHRRLTLADVPDSEFDFWQRCGFTHLWLMGVWTLGRRGRAHSQRAFAGPEYEFRGGDIAGSPYAVTGYSVSRKLGDDTALADFRRRLNDRGIKLVLDFIPNHTALDHPWVKTHPEFYVGTRLPRAGAVKPFRAATKWLAHGHCGFGEPWVDTLQLDYRNPELRQAMLDEVLSVSAKCDGVRCDMAMLVLNDVFARTWHDFAVEVQPSVFTTASPLLERPRADRTPAEFWAEAIAAVRERYSGFLFLAEVYWDLESRLQQLGFDFAYDKRLYDHIVARDAPRIAAYLHALTPDFLSRSAHFIENHDEPRIASLLPFEEHRAAALLIVALPGLRFLHEGQIAGLRQHANVHFARRGEEPLDRSVAVLYERLFAALRQTAVGKGEWRLLGALPANSDESKPANFVLVQWQREPDAFDLAVVNLGAVRSQCFAPLEIERLASGRWMFSDLLGDEVHERNGDELARRGLDLDLRPHGAQLFHCERIQ